MADSGCFSPYQTFIYTTRYSRWIDDKKCRETWPETVDRYISFFSPRLPEADRDSVAQELREAILNLDVVPSMRALSSAGKALARDNAAGYNCCFVAINHPRCFDEILYLNCCGCGVGFSVERQFVNKMPVVAEDFHQTETVIKVHDSKIGWAKALRELISLLYSGQIPSWDVSAVRPKGARLKTFGGRASGPEPLVLLFRHVVDIFRNAAGRQLTSIECHDIICHISSATEAGGVRRAALISLSNLSDDRMREAKSGQWWETDIQRAFANNSAVYTEKPDAGTFMREWLSLYRSKSGERGIFNRYSAQMRAKSTGRRKWEEKEFVLGTNPCAEISLRSTGQMCNLSEVIVRPEDTEETLHRKVRLATIIGTLQATLTDFRYLRKAWKDNCEEERLLGVSITGIMDNPITYTNNEQLKQMLTRLKETAIVTNKEWAEKLGIAQAAAITCVKPSGNTSAMCGTSSGIHPAYARYILRSVRQSVHDPVTIMLQHLGVPNESDITKLNDSVVFYFPLKTPDCSVLRADMTALDQLELHHTYQNFWAEHAVSNTIYVREHEWLDVAAWVWKHFNELGGLSFLPWSDHIYKQPPYEEISEEVYRQKVAEMPMIDWSKLSEFEKEDATTSTREAACSAGVCEL